jgi:hypothetical protein
MITLREEVQQSLNALQELLDKHQDDKVFLQAVKKKWEGEYNVCRVFVLSHLEEAKRLPVDKGGRADDKGRKNVPIPKQELELPE